MKATMISKKMIMLEEGIAPIGVHQGKKIAELPEKTLLYYSDKFEEINDTIYGKYLEACLDAAMALGYIQKRDKARAIQLEIDRKSDFVGEEGSRCSFSGVLEKVWFKRSEWSEDFYVNKIIDDNKNIVMYFGNKLGEQGQTITFDARIKRHNLREGVKSTVVNRPTKIEVL